MKPTLTRRVRRSAASHEGSIVKKDTQQEQNFFGDATHETFFQPAPVVQRKCTDCEKEEKKVQRQPGKKEEEKKLQRAEDKKEEDKVMKMGDKKEEKVMKMEDKKEEEKIQKKDAGISSMPSNNMSTSNNMSNYIGSLNGKGQPLPAGINYFFSSKMGYDFSNVKMHTDKEAAQSAKGINAKAYTIGNNIVFNEGQYNSGSSKGKKLIAHELAHVVQQNNLSNNRSIKRKNEHTFWFKDPDKQKKPGGEEIETSAQARERVFVDPIPTTISGGPSIQFAFPSSEMSTEESANIKSAKKKITEAIAKIIADLGALPDAKDAAEMTKNETIRAKLKETLKSKGPINIFIATEPDLLGQIISAYTTRVFVNLADVGDEKKLHAALSVPLMFLMGGIMPQPGGKTDTIPSATEAQLKETLLHEMLHALLINNNIDAETIYKLSKSKRKITGDKTLADDFETLVAYYIISQEEIFVYDHIQQFYGSVTPFQANYVSFVKNVNLFLAKRKLNMSKLSKKIPVTEKVNKKVVSWAIDFLIPEGTVAVTDADKDLLKLLVASYPLSR